jgi:glycosyltransferase involved in cell wall biosynthesis
MISILTSAYIDTIEKLEWLNEAIASVQSQMFEDWELILIDDASPMGISLANPDDKIRQLRTSHQSGPSACRNTAAALARYDCLLPLDADDILAAPDVLSLMYQTWRRDKTKVIYGNLRRLTKKDGDWQLSKELSLPEYTFKASLDPEGIMTVSSMHSIEAWKAAGGWKVDMEAGLEDVEYWISCGKAGFCGQKLDTCVLHYRRHDDSRSGSLRTGNRREIEMRNLIREKHKDVYEGRYPMGCCGGGGSSYVPPETYTQRYEASPSTLDNYPTNEKVWVEYVGLKEAGFGVVGPFKNISYEVNGVGHKLEVHVNDLAIFRQAGRGLDFKIGVAAPNGHQAPEPKPQNGTVAYNGGEPELAQVLTLDQIAAGV